MTVPLGEAPLVLLLRSPDQGPGDRYVRAFSREGFRAVCRPVLRFVLPGDEEYAGDDVRSALLKPEQYAGLVLTSPRAAHVVAEELDCLGGAAAAWKAKPAYAVGAKTATLLRQAGLRTVGEESGQAEALGAVIAKEENPQSEGQSGLPLLFLCGNRRRETLPLLLRRVGVPFEERIVYETHLRSGPWLEDAPDWVAFFSPSGVQAVQQSREAGWAAIRKAAIGPTTADALRRAGWQPEAVAHEPSPAALAEAVTEAHDQGASGA